MRLQDDIDFTTLNWVKQELDETLKQAHQALEAYVEDPADSSLMRFCATYLHQVQGTLRMVELYGAAMVVEEMERVALALLDGQVKPQDETFSVLMRGIVQLPDYLERLQSGHKDIPIVLLPLLNDLRATRGEKLLTESVLFSPDLSTPLPTAADGAAQALGELELKATATKLRVGFQLSLLRWFRDDKSAEHLLRMIDILDRLRAISSEEESRRLWWIVAAVVESLQSGELAASVAVKLLLGKVDREIKRLIDNGNAAFRSLPPRELIKNLLYYIAHSTSSGPRAMEVASTYKLSTLLPSEKELEHAKGSISGHNRTLLDTVSAAIKEDLLRVKEALDIYLRAQSHDPAELLAQVDVLDRVGDTLGMLGLGVPRRVVLEQRVIVEEIANKSRAADEGTLLDVAGALLYVEASLDDHIDRLGAGAAPDEGQPAAMELPKAEVRKILDALMKEASVNIAQAKQDIVAFIESPWDHARVEPIPRLLDEISGALRMLALAEPAQLMTGIVRFVEVELLRYRRVPTAEQMDKLADALASIEYYLEATREQRGGREKILDVTRSSLEALGYWPVPDDEGGGGAPAPVAPLPGGESGRATRLPPVAPAPGTRAEFQRPPSAASAPAFAAPAAAISESGSTSLHDAASTDSEFPTWGEHLPASGGASLNIDNIALAESAEMPSIELPADDSLDQFLSLVGHDEPEARASAELMREELPFESIELHSPIDIAPGKGLEDLIVGEVPAHEKAHQDVAGLRLAETESSVISLAHEPRFIEIEEEIEEQVEEQADGTKMSDASFQAVPSDDIDEEIREVFVEEVQEEIDNLRRNLPIWKANLQDFERLKPIRRSFHTLKGSGRLVGALALGEFSWKVENMFNRVLDKSIEPSPAVQALADHAIEALPDLLAGLRGGGVPKANIGGIMSVADRLAAGEETWLESVAPRRTKTIKRIVKRMVPAPLPELPVVAARPSSPHAPSVPAELTETIDITREFDMPEAELVAFAGSAHSSSEFVGGMPLPSIDPVLFDILRSEVAAHLSVLDTYHAQASAARVPATEPLLRAVHTLNGAIAMVDIPVISHVLAPLEGYVKRLRAGNAAPDARGLRALADTSKLVKAVMLALESPQPVLPQSDSLAQAITALRDALPEPELAHTLFALADEVSPEELPTKPAFAAPSAPAAPTIGAATDSVPVLEEQSITMQTDATADAELLAALEDFSAGGSGVGDAGYFAEEITLDSLAPNDDDLTAAWVRQLDDAQAPAVADERAAGIGANEKIPTGDAALASDLAFLADSSRSAPNEQPLPEEPALSIDPPEAFDFFDGLQATPESASSAIESSSSQLPHKEQVPIAASKPALLEQPKADSAAPSERDLAGLNKVPEFVAAALPEPAPEPVPELPPIADDVQPEGRLELADMDEDLLEIFVQEGSDILDHSDGLMAKLREAPHDRDLITGLQRDLHTLKGGARMAGLAPIGDLSHAMESLLEAITEGRRGMVRTTVESFERGFDRLHGLVQRVAKRQAMAMPENAIARFELLVSGRSLTDAAAASPHAPAATPPVETTALAGRAVVETSPGPAAVEPRRPGPRQLPTFEDEEAPQRAPQEMIRVRSELLDSLVNYAGEVSIYRSRLEQQISTFRFNLVEFEQTVARLREQLRKLEIETEAQIIARYQREHHESANASFDPLELDRFSQLQQLSRALAESVSDLVSIQGLLDDLTRQSETLLLQQSRVSSDLQEGLMRTRMVPFDSLVPSLRRTLRQAASEVGKRAQLKVEGAQGEMDRNLLERMKAPFEHMLRNALAHGIESPEERLEAGKPTDGTVTIQVSREATEVVLRVSDDGKGLDRDAIRKKALERGLMRPDAQLSDRDLYGFILETGFSTAEKITQLAGRGVGMDVVHNEIKQLGGSLAIDSTRGKGSTFIIRLPFTLAVTQAILVKLGDSTYAIPMSSVQGVVRITREDLEKRMGLPNPSYTYVGEDFLIYELWQLLGLPPTRSTDEAQVPLLMTRTGDQRAAVRIDGVIGSREVVVKSVGPQISSVPGIFGATIMGDGSVVMIIDLAPLVRRAAALRASVEAGEQAYVPAPVFVAPVVRRQPLVMVVDDSITMRKVTTRVLERNDMEVLTAKDGLDAVEKLQDKVPDLMLLDIEMPRMDGYELATYMKNDPRLKLVPIIMITSRTGEKHRQRALEIGVERYLGKPYQEADLLRNVQETLRLSRV